MTPVAAIHMTKEADVVRSQDYDVKTMEQDVEYAGKDAQQENEGYSTTCGDLSTVGDVSPEGSPCGDFGSSSGEESTADGVSRAGGGCDSDSSRGEQSTADDVSPSGGRRDSTSSTSGGGSSADDVSQKDKLKEPLGIPVAHQVGDLVTKGKDHERGGPSPMQAAIRFAIAASGNQHARPASSADTQAEMLVPAVTAVLGHLVAMGCRKQRVTIFHATRVPQVSLADYLRRIATYYPCSDQCLVLGLIYLDRLMVKHPEFVVSGLSIHRLIATAMTISSKFLYDISYRNEHYAKVVGLKAKELSFLEAHFLKLMDWRLNVTTEEYDHYHANVMASYPGGLIAQRPAVPQLNHE